MVALVSALASGARGLRFDPHSRQGEVLVSEHAFLSVICRDDIKQLHYPLDLDVNWMSPVQGKSPPVQVKEPYGNLDMVNYRLSSCNPEFTKYTPTRQVVYRDR